MSQHGTTFKLEDSKVPLTEQDINSIVVPLLDLTVKNISIPTFDVKTTAVVISINLTKRNAI